MKIKQCLLFVIIVAIMLFSCKNDVDNEEKAIAYLKISDDYLSITPVETNLEVPWDIDSSLPDKLWFTEQNGTVYLKDLITDSTKKMYKVPDVIYKKSYGLLGMAVHPLEPYIFLHYTFTKDTVTIQSRLVRYTYDSDTLKESKILINNISGNTYHNGSRLVISPDGKLIFSMGEVGDTPNAQNDSVITGKILRLNIDGTVPKDNPIKDSYIYTRGHRNPQGLAFSDKTILYSSEHGPNNDDEINLIVANKNYGWSDAQGFCDTESEQEYCATHNITEPLKAWTPTIAVAGLAFYNNDKIPEWQNSLLLANLKGRALRVLKLSANGQHISDEHIYLQKKFGRIRDVAVAPKGDIYFATSNRDWHPRFQPWMYDSVPEGPDKIYRIRAMPKDEELDPKLAIYEEDKEPLKLESENWNPDLEDEFVSGGKLYANNCMSCHGPNGQGSEDLIPPLSGTDWVTGVKGKLIRTVLTGLSYPIEVNGKKYNQEMPSYSQLTDQEIADILTYIRGSFDNETSGIIMGEVFEERKSIK
ncbi:MAG: PQQ-dependent sugar dehydrogenase [Leeuwenhoekiella sp.]